MAKVRFGSITRGERTQTGRLHFQKQTPPDHTSSSATDQEPTVAEQKAHVNSQFWHWGMVALGRLGGYLAKIFQRIVGKHGGLAIGIDNPELAAPTRSVRERRHFDNGKIHGCKTFKI